MYIFMVAATRNVGSLRVGDLLSALPSSSNKSRKTKSSNHMSIARPNTVRRKRTVRKLTMGSKKHRRTERQKKTTAKLMDKMDSLFSGFKL